MKRLILNGQQQEYLEAERIVVDRVNGTIIGYNGKQEVFALRGVNFSLLNYEVEGGEDAPEHSEIDLIGQLLVEKELQILQLQQDNATLGRALVDLELRIMQLEGGVTE